VRWAGIIIFSRTEVRRTSRSGEDRFVNFGTGPIYRLVMLSETREQTCHIVNADLIVRTLYAVFVTIWLWFVELQRHAAAGSASP